MNNKMKIISVFLIIAILASSLVLAVCAAPTDEIISNPSENPMITNQAGNDKTKNNATNDEETTAGGEKVAETEPVDSVEENNDVGDETTNGDITVEPVDTPNNEEYTNEDDALNSTNVVKLIGLDQYENVGIITIKFKQCSGNKSSFKLSFTEDNSFTAERPLDMENGKYKIKIVSTGNMDEIVLANKTIEIKDGSVDVQTKKIIQHKTAFQTYILDSWFTIVLFICCFTGYLIFRNRRIQLENQVQ